MSGYIDSDPENANRIRAAATSVANLSEILINIEGHRWIDDDVCGPLKPHVEEWILRELRLDQDVMEALKRRIRRQLQNSHDTLRSEMNRQGLIAPDVRLG